MIDRLVSEAFGSSDIEPTVLYDVLPNVTDDALGFSGVASNERLMYHANTVNMVSS